MAEPRRAGSATTTNRAARDRAAYTSPRVMGVRTDRSSKNDTEGGLTQAQRRTVLAEERRVMGRRTEAASIINPQGEVVRRLSQNNARNVSFFGIPDSELRNAVVTHNHPGSGQRRAYGNTLATRVGSPFSAQDLVFAASNDIAEMRAVTYSGDGGGYIYSIRRPAGGWAVTNARDLLAMRRRVTARGMDYVMRNSSYYQQGRQQASRAELMAQWTTIQDMARELGARITRRRFNQ